MQKWLTEQINPVFNCEKTKKLQNNIKKTDFELQNAIPGCFYIFFAVSNFLNSAGGAFFTFRF